MLSIPQILQTKAEPAAVIHITTARNQMMKVFGPAVGELMAALSRQGVTPSSAVFAHHLKMSADTFDFELGVTVAAPVKTDGRVKPGELPAARVARAIYSGPYEGLPSAWGEFNAWLKTNGHAPGDSLWELYSIGPQVSSDPTLWRTELTRPLKT